MSERFNPLQLPSVNLSELNKLPECTAIYFAIDAEEKEQKRFSLTLHN